MSWFRVDDKLHSHVKALDAGLEAMGLWLFAGSYCMDHLTDGVVHRAVAERLGGKRYAALAKRLVAVGLWREHERGWIFHDWNDCQPTTEEMNEKRASVSAVRAAAGRNGGHQSAEARRRRRQANGQANPEANQKQTGKQNCEANGQAKVAFAGEATKQTASPIPIPILDPPIPPEGVGVPGDPESRTIRTSRLNAESQQDGTFGMTGEAFRAGIAAATRRPCSPLSPRDHQAVQRLVAGHAEGVKGEALLAWVKAAAERFVQANDPRFGYRPERCVAWFDAGCVDARKPADDDDEYADLEPAHGQ